MMHGRVLCPVCDAVILSCKCPGPHQDRKDTKPCRECSGKRPV